MAITAKELAKKLNLSATAVSMALNNKPGVSTATRDQVIKAAEKYGYDFTRLSLKNGHPGDIYCIIYRAHNAILNYMPIFSELTDGIEQECRNQGYQLKLVQINEKRDDVQKWIEDLRIANCAGIILLGTETSIHVCQMFLQLSVPVLLLDSHYDSLGCSSVLINNRQGLTLLRACSSISAAASLGICAPLTGSETLRSGGSALTRLSGSTECLPPIR